MASAVVKDNHLTFDGKRYFRGGAEDVELGSYGEKKMPLFGQNYLEVQGRIPAGRLKIKEATEAGIDFSQTTEKDFGVTVKYATAEGAASGSYQRVRSGNLKLVKLLVNNEDMERAVNQSPNIRNNLEGYGNDARIAHQVFVVTEAKLAESLAASTSFDVSVSGSAVKITGKGRSSGETTLTISKGTTFAYLLVKLDWNDSKTRIVKITDDQWSFS